MRNIFSISAFFPRKVKPAVRSGKSNKKTILLVISKRQKFIIAVLFLSIALFVSELQFGRFGSNSIYIAFVLSFLTDIFLFWAVKDDLEDANLYTVFILPFFYSLAFGLFYFLIPARLLFRLILTLLYAFGLYSLFLSQNIFIVGAIRTIQLLSGARIVSFVITLLSFFFLSNIVFSLHIYIFYEAILVFIYTFLLMYHAIWTYTLQKMSYSILIWVLGLTLCLFELAVVIWFWPASPTIIAIFLSGYFYTIVGLSHVWLEKRLFKGVLLEYMWVAAIAFFALLLFTSWGK